ncbi:unnamed protein product [Durusdinium trenchii]|uniref:Uncharacterized protein n=2 Tax=Durusdinium trenchii TaxID=1381693 RepID=A0ABP0P216_9DINO
MDFDELDELDPVEVPDLGRDLAVIILGATGYTGSLMVEHLDALVDLQPKAEQLKWGVAGRNLAKLKNVASHCRSCPQIFHVSDDAQLDHMVSKGRVVISAIGPYALCGEAVVEACVKNSTHYVDITGEVPWMYQMVQKYHARAEELKTKIVLSAGNVCAPDEILCYSLVRTLGPLKDYREYFSQFGGISGGTLQTNITSLCSDEDGQIIAKDPFCLGGRGSKDRPEDLDCDQVEADSLYPSVYLAPAYNSSTGSRVLRRSAELFAADLRYGQELRVVIREGHLQRAMAEQQLQSFSTPKKEAADALLQARERDQAPWPGFGPPKELRKLYGAEIIALAQAESGHWAYARWTSGCAYEVSAMCAVCGALVLAEEAGGAGGVLTPAFAFHGTTWIDRLQEVPFANRGGQKIALEIHEGKPTEEILRAQISERNRRVMIGQQKLLKLAKPWKTPALCESSI